MVIIISHCLSPITLLGGQGERSVSRSKVKFKGLGQVSGMQRSISGARLAESKKMQFP